MLPRLLQHSSGLQTYWAASLVFDTSRQGNVTISLVAVGSLITRDGITILSETRIKESQQTCERGNHAPLHRSRSHSDMAMACLLTIEADSQLRLLCTCVAEPSQTNRSLVPGHPSYVLGTLALACAYLSPH
jgi:hypothetical protein